MGHVALGAAVGLFHVSRTGLEGCVAAPTCRAPMVKMSPLALDVCLHVWRQGKFSVHGLIFQGVVMGKQLTAGDICKRKVTVGYKHTSLVAAAQLMREDHVGSLVVVDDENGSRQVRGLITDRDIVMSVVATGLDPEPLRLEDIMTEDVITASETDSLLDLMRAMRVNGVRRVPVVGFQDELMGIVSMDDVLKILAHEMNTLVGSIDVGLKQERARRQ
jgi:CBS domain-containing protein